MGLFTKKAAEQKQEAMEAKFNKAEASLERGQKITDRERAAYDKETMTHKIALMEAGLDVRAATGIITRKTSIKDGMKALDYMVAMPESVVIYTVANSATMKAKFTPVQNTETVPYKSIHTVDFKDGLINNTITFKTSGESYEFETSGFGKFIVETINERKASL